MARNKMPAAEPVEAPLNTKALAKANSALTELGKRSAEIAERFADGMPYERERVVTEAKFLMAQSAEAMLEAGKRLIQIKENEPWGDFTVVVEKQLGLNPRTARLMMQAAVKYLSPALESKRQTFAVLERSKLFDLMVESEDDLAELAEGGTIAGKTLDEMQSMSVRELREALAEARQTNESRQKLLDKANSKVDRLQEKLDKPFKPAPESIARTADEAAMLKELNDAFADAHLASQRVVSIAGEVFDRFVDGEPLAAHARNCIDHVIKALASLAANYSIEVDLTIAEAQMAPWVSAQLAPAGIEAVAQHAAGKKAR